MLRKTPPFHPQKTPQKRAFRGMVSIRSATDYSPFGVQLENRNFLKAGLAEDYRMGFQGQEEDDEVKGDGNSVNYTYRMHDPRLGRFFAVDGLTKKYPELSPYQFASNTPICAIDQDGLEAVVVITGQTVVKNKHKKGDYYMYQVNIYENMTMEQYKDLYSRGELKNPTATAIISRDAWRKPNRSDRSDKRYGSLNETPPGEYYLEYSATGYGDKKYNLKVSDKAKGDIINGIDGKRDGVRIHQYSPHDAEGCFTTGSGTSTTEVRDFITKIPSLEAGKEVRLIVEEREAEFNPVKQVWEGTENNEAYKPNLQKVGEVIFDSNKIFKHEGHFVATDINTGKHYGVVRDSNTGKYDFKRD